MQSSADPRQGADRERICGARLLGHRGVRAAGLTTTFRRPPGRAPVAAFHPGPGARAPSSGRAAPLSPGGRSAGGMWRVLAGRFRGVPHQCRHRKGGGPQLEGRKTRGSSGRWAPPAGRNGAVWRRLGYHDVTAGSGLTGSPVRTVQRDRRQQRLHEPDVPANLRAAADAVERQPIGAPARGWTRRRPAAWRDAAEAMLIPYARGARRARAGRGVHRARGVGLRRHEAGSRTRCCCTSPTTTCIASRW